MWIVEGTFLKIYINMRGYIRCGTPDCDLGFPLLTSVKIASKNATGNSVSTASRDTG